MVYNVLVMDSVDSTVDEAKRLGDAPELTIVLAREERRRRRRGGGEASSPKGGLWFTMVTYPNISSTISPLLTLGGALAVAKGIRKTTGLMSMLRWPCEVYVHGGRVAYILTEALVVDDIVKKAFVSVGINANLDRETLDEEEREISTTLTRELGKEVKLEELLSSTVEEFTTIYEYLKTGWREPLLREIIEYMELRGSPVVVELGYENLMGIMEGIDDIGRMLLRVDRDRILLSPGDVKSIYPT